MCINNGVDDFSQLCLPGPKFLAGYNNRGGEFRRGVNPLRDRLKLENCVTRAMWVVMKLVRVASNRHLRNWIAPNALVQEIIPVAS